MDLKPDIVQGLVHTLYAVVVGQSDSEVTNQCASASRALGGGQPPRARRGTGSKAAREPAGSLRQRQAIVEAVQRARVVGGTWEQIVGHLNHAFCVQREALSVLRFSHDF